MREKRAKLLSPAQRILILFVLAAVAGLALRNALVTLFAQAQPSLALALPPASGTALGVAAAQERLAPAQRRRAAAAALARAPASHWPLAASAAAALDEGDADGAERLLEAAVRRNSRHVDSRSRLFRLYLAGGRWGEAIDEGVALARLRSAMSASVMDAILALLPEIRGRAILAGKLRRRADGSAPPLREALERAAAGRPAARQLAELIRRADAAPRAGPAVSPQGYLDWTLTLPAAALAHVRGVYDGQFRRLPGAPPFNWTLAGGPGARARIDPGAPGPGILIAEATEARPRVLARQLLALPEGPHVLVVDGTAAAGSRMSWRLRCLSGPGLAELELLPASRLRRLRHPLLVPPRCAFQELSLVGSAAQAGAKAASRTSLVAVRPAS